MSALLIITYDISDPEKYVAYNPGSLPVVTATLAKHDGELIVAQEGSDYLDGARRSMTVVLRFPTEAAAKAWHDDPEYVPVRALRYASTSNTTALVCTQMPGT